MNLDKAVYAVVAIVIAVGAVLAALASGPNGLDNLNWMGTIRAKKLVADQLRDPSSAQFRNVFRHDGTVCGQVNGKNGFGAYVGFRRFYVYEDAVAIEPDQTSPIAPGLPPDWKRFDLGWQYNCT